MSTDTPDINENYDFVIVGGGTSGLTVANRLSENASFRILVLEAGHNHLEDPRVQIPALCMQAAGSDLDWQFVTTPQVGPLCYTSYGVSSIQALLTPYPGRAQGPTDQSNSRSPSWRFERYQQSSFHKSFL